MPINPTLEDEVKILKIKLETMINHMELQFANPFGPPGGRTLYDQKVKAALKKAGLRE